MRRKGVRLTLATIVLACAVSLSACKQPASTSPQEAKPVSEAPKVEKSLDREDFMTGCLESCKANNKASADFSQFCHSYCVCSFEDLENKVPFDHLQAYSKGNPTESTSAIRGILKQCAAEAMQNVKEKHGGAQ